MTTITSTDLRNKSIGLYTPPFRFEHGYIWDAKGQMVADNLVDGEDAALRVRGWGRISYMENPEALQDEVGNVIALAMTEFWERCVSDKAEPIYQVQYGNDWRDVERAQYDDHAAHGSPVRVVYATPPAPVVPEELLSAMEEVLRISDRDHEAWHKARNGIVSCRASMLDNCATVESRNHAACSTKNGLKCAAARQGSQPVSNRDELLPGIKPAPELDSVAKNAESLPGNSPVIGWLRSDYNNDDKRDPNAPLFMLGSNDPSETWGVKYLPLSGNSPVIPDGYVLVPIVPTEDMVINGFESEPDPHFSDEKEWAEYEALSGCRQAARRAELCWAAMLSAAPKI